MLAIAFVARNRILTVTTVTGHTFRLHLHVALNAKQQPFCYFRINQFAHEARLDPDHGLLLPVPESLRYALRAQVGLPKRKEHLVRLSPEVLAWVQSEAVELLLPFVEQPAHCRNLPSHEQNY